MTSPFHMDNARALHILGYAPGNQDDEATLRKRMRETALKYHTDKGGLPFQSDVVTSARAQARGMDASRFQYAMDKLAEYQEHAKARSTAMHKLGMDWRANMSQHILAQKVADLHRDHNGDPRMMKKINRYHDRVKTLTDKNIETHRWNLKLHSDSLEAARRERARKAERDREEAARRHEIQRVQKQAQRRQQADQEATRRADESREMQRLAEEFAARRREQWATLDMRQRAAHLLDPMQAEALRARQAGRTPRRASDFHHAPGARPVFIPKHKPKRTLHDLYATKHKRS